jgi:anti-sigma factor RsiW
MSDDTRERGCPQYADDLAELALGVLTGRDRARTLSHVESCRRCADELEQLSRVADTVVEAAPEVEPPVGFEVRLFERMGVADLRAKRHRRFRASRLVPFGVAAAVVGLGLGLGLTLSSSPAPTTTAQPQRSGGISADLVAHGVAVGKVEAFGGAKPWMSMSLEDSPTRGTVMCAVTTKDGVTHWVGSFVARTGYGAWAAPLHVDPAKIRTAEVVSPSGTVIATATLG